MYSNLKDTVFKNYSDEQLVPLAKTDTNAFNEIISRYIERILIKANKLSQLNSYRDDLVQEGFLGLINAVYCYNADKGSKFSSFADVCIQNKMNTAIKKIYGYIPPIDTKDNYLLNNSEDNEETSLDGTPEDILIEKETFSDMLKILSKKLSKREFEILMLFSNELSYAEISKKLGISIKSVDNAIQRIRRKIKVIWSIPPKNL